MLTLLKRLPVIITLFISIVVLIVFLFLYLISDIPDYKDFNEYQYFSITRLYSSDQQVLDEFADEHRVYITYNDIPKVVIDAFIAVEDKKYFYHQGVDYLAILRAWLQNIVNIVQNKRLVGGSTITQQVVKGFFLSNKRNLSRKIKEAVLAYRISKIASKQKILEVYLNQIYLGKHSYGIYIAAQNYFGKELNDLNIEEAAMLASLPKAPSSLNPYRNYQKAFDRRNWAISRMFEESYITQEQEMIAMQAPIKLSYSKIRNNQYKNYYTDAVKNEVLKMFGPEYLFRNGLMVNTNVDLKFQEAAQKALRSGLREYDKKNGWRGVFAHINEEEQDIQLALKRISQIKYHDDFKLAYIKQVNTDNLLVVLKNKKELTLTQKNLRWVIQNKKIASIFKKRDVILLNDANSVMQIPEVNGAVVVIENKSGKILSMVGGYDLRQSNFNRVTQAKRQPGSVFKTFVYLAALEQGVEPNTQLLDEPIEIKLGHGLPKYTPKNYKESYQGIITLRRSFERSINLSTIRLLMGIGLESLKEVATRYKIYPDNVTATYSMGLGAYETTLLKMTNAYASIANSGFMMKPKLIESIYNREGNLIYASGDIFCENCDNIITHDRYPRVRAVGQVMTDAITNYQILSLLEGAVQRGSAQRAKWLNKVIAGKTGTTNNSKDAWFIGMTPDITVGVYVGYDEPKTLGKNITGSNLALPIFNTFITRLKEFPDRPFLKPKAIDEKYILLEEGDIISDQQAKKLLKTGTVFKEVFKKNPNQLSKSDVSGKGLLVKEKSYTPGNEDIFNYAKSFLHTKIK